MVPDQEIIWSHLLIPPSISSLLEVTDFSKLPNNVCATASNPVLVKPFQQLKHFNNGGYLTQLSSAQPACGEAPNAVTLTDLRGGFQRRGGNSWRWGVEQRETFDTSWLNPEWQPDSSETALSQLYTAERGAVSVGVWLAERCLVNISPRQPLLPHSSPSSPGLRTRAGAELRDTVTALPVTGDKLAPSDSGRGSRSSLPLPSGTRGSGGGSNWEQFVICFAPEQLQGAFQGTLTWLKAWANQNGKARLGWLEEAALTRV